MRPAEAHIGDLSWLARRGAALTLVGASLAVGGCSTSARFDALLEKGRREVAARDEIGARDSAFRALELCEVHLRGANDCRIRVSDLRASIERIAAPVVVSREEQLGVSSRARGVAQRLEQEAHEVSVANRHEHWSSVSLVCGRSTDAEARGFHGVDEEYLAPIVERWRHECDVRPAMLRAECQRRFEPLFAAGRLAEAREVALHSRCPVDVYDRVAEATLATYASAVDDPARACEATAALVTTLPNVFSEPVRERVLSARQALELACVRPQLPTLSGAQAQAYPLSAWLVARLGGSPPSGAASQTQAPAGFWPALPTVALPSSGGDGSFRVVSCRFQDLDFVAPSPSPSPQSTQLVTDIRVTTRNGTVVNREVVGLPRSVSAGSPAYTPSPGTGRLRRGRAFAQIEEQSAGWPGVRFSLELPDCDARDESLFQSARDAARTSLVGIARLRLEPPASEDEQLEAVLGMIVFDREDHPELKQRLLRRFRLPPGATLWPIHF